MKQVIKRFCVVAPLALAAFSAQSATTQTWDLTTGDTSSPYANSWAYTNANGKTLTLKAFYVDNLTNTSTTTSNAYYAGTIGDTTRSSALQADTKAGTLKSGNGTTQAGIGSFGGNGVGISNPYDTPATNGQENSTGGQHAIDNYDVNDTTGAVVRASGTPTSKHAQDFLLMDFNEVMTLDSFRVGWTAYGNTGVDFFVAPDTVTGPVDLSAAATNSVAELIALGWKQVSFDAVTACAISTSSPSCPTQFSGGTGYSLGMKSRYVIASGALGGNDDAFKFSQITMTSASGGSTPIPGTAALLLAGFAGFAWSRRKVPTQA